MNLIQVHIGSVLPDYIFDSLYQTLLINEYSTKIYMIIDDNLIETFNEKIDNFAFDIYTKTKFNYKSIIQVIPLSLLEMNCLNDNNFNKYKNIINSYNISDFRDGFWISTTARFYYISILMKLFDLKKVFHIENDIVMYKSFDDIYNNIYNTTKIQQICMVQDSPGRVIPSILYFPDYTSIYNLTQYITNELSNVNFKNDMDILGSYQDRITFNTEPDNVEPDNVEPDNANLIFDGAALGQYLGGVDYRNINGDNDEIVKYNNPTRGFINETAILKANKYDFTRPKKRLDHLNIDINTWQLFEKSCDKNQLEKSCDKNQLEKSCDENQLEKSCDKKKSSEIANLHIHSKQLYQFSSIFDLNYNDIISGDRILSLCDFVILTRPILDFHKNIHDYAKDIIMINDPRNIKLFVYTHLLDLFQEYILPKLNKNISFILYLHNSDHSLNNSHKKVILSKCITKIYAQNIDIGTDIKTDKITLLPIGIANSMWNHGDITTIYKVMSKTYNKSKKNGLYININPNTYFYRGLVLEKIKKNNSLKVSQNKPYNEYLEELSNCRFCLCIRGNGPSTHREFESYYLGVIPVFINNKETKMESHIKYMKKLGLPFYEINDINQFDTLSDDHFSEVLYKKVMGESSIFNLPQLKLGGYAPLRHTD